jgi:hypothetical protein
LASCLSSNSTTESNYISYSCSLDFNRDRVVLLVVIGMTGTCDGEFGDNVVVIEGDWPLGEVTPNHR